MPALPPPIRRRRRCRCPQFCSGRWCVQALSWCPRRIEGSASTEVQDAWDDIISEEIVEPDAISFAHTLKAAGCPTPSTVGFELDGVVLAELVWEELKVAVQLPGQTKHKETLESDGWHVYEMGSTEAIVAIKGA